MLQIPHVSLVAIIIIIIIIIIIFFFLFLFLFFIGRKEEEEGERERERERSVTPGADCSALWFRINSIICYTIDFNLSIIAHAAIFSHFPTPNDTDGVSISNDYAAVTDEVNHPVSIG